MVARELRRLRSDLQIDRLAQDPVTRLLKTHGERIHPNSAPLIRRILQAVPLVRERSPELRVVTVAGPRIDPASLNAPAGVQVRAFVPDLEGHLAACDLAVVQGGLTTCMELTAAGTPFLYFPLRHHFEQNFHVAHRLER